MNFKIDFVKLLNYFQKKYPHLKDVRYYEGIATDDEKKRKMFSFLECKGYTICSLERKSYNSIETEEREIKCPKCNHRWTAKFTKEHKAMKSNVDVYLATELLTIAHKANRSTHIILVSCDGDYSEMIKNALENNQHLTISVLATPPTRNLAQNTLSVRLKVLRGKLPRYHLTDIRDIADLIRSEK